MRAGMIRLQRVYSPPTAQDGRRFLVDRLWPRGIRKEALEIEAWVKDAAPSDALRKTFHHDASRWEEFKQAYFAELEAHPQAWQSLLEAARAGTITLLFAAKDEIHNNAAALKQFLEAKLNHAG